MGQRETIIRHSMAREPNLCPVLERTADGVPVGRCFYFIGRGDVRTCSRHGDVTAQVSDYLITGRLQDDPRVALQRVARRPDEALDDEVLRDATTMAQSTIFYYLSFPVFLFLVYVMLRMLAVAGAVLALTLGALTGVGTVTVSPGWGVFLLSGGLSACAGVPMLVALRDMYPRIKLARAIRKRVNR